MRKQNTSTITRTRKGFLTRVTQLDRQLLIVVLILLLWGLVMVYSSSIAIPDHPRFNHLSPYHFLLRHSLYLALGLSLSLIVFYLPMQFWYRIAPWLFIISLLLLGLVLLPFIPEINGARRWISLGFIRFQPSEIAKFAILLYAANYMIRKMEVRERFSHAILPMVIALSITGSLLLSEPDMGAFLIVSIIALGILFLGGVKLRTLLLLLLVITIVFMLSVLMVSWRLERFFAYLDPWDDAYALGKGYQLTNALIAIGRGGVFGVGLGASVEKLHWLPESHTDFLLAIIGEELGLIGIVVLVILFFGLSHRLILIGRQAITMERVFSGLVIQGIALWFASQAFIHMGVNLGVLPTTGLTLPFMSYGGSALVINLLAIALALRVDYENQQLMQGGRP